MKILINNQEQDNIKAIQVDDYWVVVNTNKTFPNIEIGYCYNSIKNTWNDDILLYQGSMPKYHFVGFQQIIASTKFIDKSIPVIKFVEKSVEELAYKWFVKANKKDIIFDLGWAKIFEAGYNQAKSSDKKYSLDDMIWAFNQGTHWKEKYKLESLSVEQPDVIKFIRSLNQSKLPDVINLEMEEYGHYEQDVEDFIVHGLRLKTTSTPEGEVIYINI